MTDREDRDPSDPGERRVIELLAELEPPPPADDTALARRIVTAARWQHAVREPLGAAARLIAAVADGVLLVASGGQRRNRP